jgi:hypothetical protein
MEMSEAGVIALSGSGITALALILKCFLKSRCSTIKICFGLLDCVRQPLTLDELKEIEIAPNKSSNHQKRQNLLKRHLLLNLLYLLSIYVVAP